MNFDSLIYIIRHGATGLNRECDGNEDRIRGHMDVPLAEAGLNEAYGIAEALGNSGIEQVFSSDLSRAWKTAEILAKHVGTVVSTTYGLRPWKLGPTIEGQPSEKIHPVIAKYFRDPDKRPPGGESFGEFKMRVFRTITDAVSSSLSRTIAIVTHYRCLKLLEARREGYEIDDALFLADGSPTGSIRVLTAGKLQNFVTDK